MSDDRRNTVDPTAPLTHADAEALISARLDGPIDPVSNRALLAHLSTCDSCRAFAGEMDVMATAFRDFPSLPPSAAVTRAVRAEIRGGGSPMRKFTRWVTTSRSAPITALAGAAVALALVATSVLGTLRDDDNNNPNVGAPGVAVNGNPTESIESAQDLPTSSSSAKSNPAPTATGIINVAGIPTPTAAPAAPTEPASTENSEDGRSTADSEVTQEPQDAEVTETTEASDGAESEPSVEPTTESSGTTDDNGEVTPTAEPTHGGGNAAIAAASVPESPEATATPVPTETPTEEPTATPEPTQTPEPEPTSTPTEEPAPTETPTEEPTPSPTPTEETSAAIEASGDSTPEATEEPSPTPTSEIGSPTPEPSPTPPISPRGNGQADDETPTEVVEENSQDETPTEEATVDEGQGSAGGDAAPTIGPADGGSPDEEDSITAATEEVTPEEEGEIAESNQAPEDVSTPEPDGQGGDNVEEATVQGGPLDFSDLESAGYSVEVLGTYLPSGGSEYAAESVGALRIVTAQGATLTSAWGYNPVWSSDGNLYAADSGLTEGSGSALITWTSDGGPGYVTQGDYRDTPAGDGSGGFYYVRWLADSGSVELHVVDQDDPIWSGEGNLIALSTYIYGDVVYIPTDLGWYAVNTGGDGSLLSPAIGNTYDLVLDPYSGSVAYVGGDGTVYTAPAGDPSAASPIGSIGSNGGIAWTPYGLAIASGSEVTINGVPIIVNGGDLGAPIWTGSGLEVADANDGGAARVITDAEIQQALAQ